MTFFKRLSKFSWLVSLILAVFYIGAGLFIHPHDSTMAYKSIGFGFFWLVLSYINKKMNKDNVSYLKLSQACAYIYEKAQDKSALSETRMLQLLYLSDCEGTSILNKPLFPEAPWSFNNYLVNPMAEFWASKSKMFHNLTSRGLSPCMMVPPKNFTNEEILVLEKIITDCETKTAYDMQQLVNNTKPVSLKITGPLDLQKIYAQE